MPEARIAENAEPREPSRERRRAAAIVAQYIHELAHVSAPPDERR